MNIIVSLLEIYFLFFGVFLKKFENATVSFRNLEKNVNSLILNLTFETLQADMTRGQGACNIACR